MQIRAYVNKFSKKEDKGEWDLLALRFLSINSIVDPWVFAILRPPVLRFMRSVLCCQVTPTSQDRHTPSPRKDKTGSAAGSLRAVGPSAAPGDICQVKHSPGRC